MELVLIICLLSGGVRRTTRLWNARLSGSVSFMVFTSVHNGRYTMPRALRLSNP
jgi:hypothetical protein